MDDVSVLRLLTSPNPIDVRGRVGGAASSVEEGDVRLAGIKLVVLPCCIGPGRGGGGPMIIPEEEALLELAARAFACSGFSVGPLN